MKQIYKTVGFVEVLETHIQKSFRILVLNIEKKTPDYFRSRRLINQGGDYRTRTGHLDTASVAL